MAIRKSVVVGTRCGFWANFENDRKSAVFALVAPVVLLWSVWRLIGIVRAGHMFDDTNLGHTVVVGGFFVVIALVSLVFTSILLGTTRTVLVESVCPRCGVVRKRNFGTTTKNAPAACGACWAYLRADGNEVSEECAEAVKTIGLPYELTSKHYLSVVRRDNHSHFKFAWPEMCAVCGNPATKRRVIGEWGKINTDLGVLGEVVHIVGNEAGFIPDRYNEMINHAAPVTTKSPSDRLDGELRHLKVPVCGKHTDDETPFDNPLEFRSGAMVFASYRYYRAFCELNRIGEADGGQPGSTLKSVSSTAGAPPASRPQ
jgi:hypothetical protein